MKVGGEGLASLPVAYITHHPNGGKRPTQFQYYLFLCALSTRFALLPQEPVQKLNGHQ